MRIGHHGLWSYRVADSVMTGTLVDPDHGATIRRIRVERVAER